MVGTTILSLTDAASQEAVVGSAQCVAVARARDPRGAVVQHCLEYLGSEHPDFELEGSPRSVVQLEGVLPEAVPCVAYASIDLDGQVSIAVNVPPRYTNSLVWLYTWPAASTLNMAVDSSIPFVRRYTISVLASDTIRPNAAHTTRIIPTIFLGCSGDYETTPASSAKSMLQSGVARTGSPVVTSPHPPALFLFLRCTKASMMSLFYLKRV